MAGREQHWDLYLSVLISARGRRHMDDKIIPYVCLLEPEKNTDSDKSTRISLKNGRGIVVKDKAEL